MRDARSEDAEAIARVRIRGWQAAYAHALPAEGLAGMSVDEGRRFWSEWLQRDRPRAAIVVGEIGGSVAGFASVGPARGEDVGELYAIYVEPENWGAGLGQALIAAAEERLVAAGFAEAILWVLEDNPRARRFYEAGGWELDGGTKQDTFFGVDVTEVRYRKRFDP